MVFKLTPHLDEEVDTIDIQYTDNIYGSWTSLINDDSAENYPKRFDNDAITDRTYLRFRIKDLDGNYSSWSKPMKPVDSEGPSPSSSLCFTYYTFRDLNTQEPLNGAKVRFRATGGSAGAGVPDVRDKTEETTNYGWIGIYLTPGRVYEVSCPLASFKKTVTIPSSHNVELGSLL